MSYLNETVPADSEAVTLGAGRVRDLKSQLDALISQIFEDAGTFLPGWITAGGATGGASMFGAHAIQSADIANGAVGTTQLAASAVTDVQIAAGTITSDKLVSGFVAPNESVATASMQPGVLAATDAGRALVAANFILPAMLGFPFIQAAIGQYAGSNSASAEVSTLDFQPTVLVLLNGYGIDGFCIAFSAEVGAFVSGASPIHASWANGAVGALSENGVQWTSDGFVVVPSNVIYNMAGKTHTYLAFAI